MNNMHDAQRSHIEQSLSAEEVVMKKFRQMAISNVRLLMGRMEEDTDTYWSRPVLDLWGTTTTLVSLAVSGRADGYFDTPYPPLSEMVKALFE